MKSVLTEDRKDTVTRSVEDVLREPLKDAYKEAMAEAEAERSARARSRKLFRSLLFATLSAAVGYALRRADPESAGSIVEKAAEPDIESIREPTVEEESGGRGLLPKLLLVGALAGLGYALSRRYGSVDEVVDVVTERTEEAAEETSERTGEFAEETSEMTEEIGETIDETGDEAAESIDETGDEVAGGIDQTAEELEDEDEGMTDDGPEFEE